MKGMNLNIHSSTVFICALELVNALYKKNVVYVILFFTPCELLTVKNLILHIFSKCRSPYVISLLKKFHWHLTVKTSKSFTGLEILHGLVLD